MSLLTRCPACTTLYKVVPDQLRISQGWVKCGQCGEIFDASQHLIEASTEAEVEPLESPVESQAIPPKTDGEVSSGQMEVEQSCTEDLINNEHLQGLAQNLKTETETETETETQAELRYVCETGSEPEVASGPDMTSQDDIAVPTGLASLVVESQAASVAQLDLASVELVRDEPSGTADQVSFLQVTDQRSVLQRPAVKVVLVLIALLLGLGLLVQWVYQDRDHLAAVRPEWKPALDSLCKTLQCSIQAVQQIESITIDSAAFNKLDVDRYRLSFTVKSSSHIALALPSIELTLTDFQDRVVVRRVFSPRELSATSDSIGAVSEWPVTVGVQVRPDSAHAGVVGYRLLAFYP